MRSVYNPIHPGYLWSQGFEFPLGWLEPADRIRSQFRVTPLSELVLAELTTENGGIVMEGDLVTLQLRDEQTDVMPMGKIVTNFTVIRDGIEIPIGQIVQIPIVWLPTRGTVLPSSQSESSPPIPIRLVPTNGVAIKLGVAPGIPGPRGPPGKDGTGEGGGASHRHIQSEALAVWTVTHDLGFRPLVQVTDTSGSLIDGDVTHLSANVTRLSFSAPFAGEARFS